MKKIGILIFILLLAVMVSPSFAAYSDCAFGDCGSTSGGGGGSATFTVCASNKTAAYTCDYTADGTNDEVQIQAAIDAAAALATGGRVLLTEGAFNISSSILPKANVWLSGQGKYITTLYGKVGLANTAVIHDTGTGTSANKIPGIAFTDFGIDGTDMSRTGYHVGRKGIFIEYLKKAIIKDLYIYNTPATGIGADFFEDSVIDGNIVANCGTAGQGVNGGSNGIGIGTKGIASYNDEKIIVTNNIAYGNANHGIMLEDQVGASSPRHYIISNNLSYSNGGYGFSVSGTKYFTMNGNRAWSNTSHGFFFDNASGWSSGIALLGSQIVNNHASENGGDGFNAVTPESNYILFANNISRDNSLIGVSFAINNSIISNNIITSNDKQGIYIPVSAALNNIDIKGNYINDNGTDNTAGENDGIEVDVTAAVNFTGLNISNNTIVDIGGVHTQRYGITLEEKTGTITDVSIMMNKIEGNSTGPYNNVDVPETEITLIHPNDGKIGIGNISPSGMLVVNPPAAQTIAATNTITDDACGTAKLITAAGAVTTSTSATFTAPAAGNEGCCMDVINVGAENITLDQNADFLSAGGADVVLGANDTVRVCSTGASGHWYQIGATGNN